MIENTKKRKDLFIQIVLPLILKENNNIRIDRKRLFSIINKSKITLEIDRSTAIKNAINDLQEEEILLIAGKGHEHHQVIGNKVIEYSDYEEVKKCTA